MVLLDDMTPLRAAMQLFETTKEFFIKELTERTGPRERYTGWESDVLGRGRSDFYTRCLIIGRDVER